MKTNKILQIAMITILLAAPMAASAYELGEKGISAADAKLYSQIGYDSTSRYEYLNGRAQDSLVEVSGKGAAKNNIKKKQSPNNGEYKMSKAQEARIHRKALKAARETEAKRKAGITAFDEYL